MGPRRYRWNGHTNLWIALLLLRAVGHSIGLAEEITDGKEAGRDETEEAVASIVGVTSSDPANFTEGSFTSWVEVKRESMEVEVVTDESHLDAPDSSILSEAVHHSMFPGETANAPDSSILSEAVLDLVFPGETAYASWCPVECPVELSYTLPPESSFSAGQMILMFFLVARAVS